jgi:uncharacterized protein YabE (DUF348 family)
MLWIFVATVMILLAATIAFARYIDREVKEVTIYDGSNTIQVATTNNTVQEVLDEYSIALEPGDAIIPAIDTPLTEEMASVTISRAFEVYVSVDNQMQTVHILEGTVADVLEQAKVDVREQDAMNYGFYQVATPGMMIQISRIDETLVLEHKAIAYEVETRKNNDMDYGTSRVIQEGEEGEREIKMLVKFVDGVQVASSYVDENVTKEPVSRIVEKGTIQTMTTSRGDSIRYIETMSMTLTAYCPCEICCGKYSSGNTASGTRATQGRTIAVSYGLRKSALPYGSKVYIPYAADWFAARGMQVSGIFTVEDVGGGVNKNQIDIYMDIHSRALQWGRKYNKTVYILK